MKIKNIIFDLGGVLYKIDKKRTVVELAKLASTEKSKLILKDYDTLTDLPEMVAFEKGITPASVFRNWFRESFESSATNPAFDDAWSALLLGLDAKAVAQTTSLFKEYRVFLLSTNNEIHYERLLPHCRDFFAQFEKTYFSHLTGFRKPDKAAFEQVLSENQLIEKETLFIDDTAGHILAASAIGISSLEFKGPQTFSLIEQKLKES